jgi:hypothetical protein
MVCRKQVDTAKQRGGREGLLSNEWESANQKYQKNMHMKKHFKICLQLAPGLILHCISMRSFIFLTSDFSAFSGRRKTVLEIFLELMNIFKFLIS